jgi:hypothetical protein
MLPQEALHRSSRAIVITEAVKALRIVNKAWEDLWIFLRGPKTRL